MTILHSTALWGEARSFGKSKNINGVLLTVDNKEKIAWAPILKLFLTSKDFKAVKMSSIGIGKSKFVLDYKIKELKKDIKPNAEQMLTLKEQTTKMNQEV